MSVLVPKTRNFGAARYRSESELLKLLSDDLVWTYKLNVSCTALLGAPVTPSVIGCGLVHVCIVSLCHLFSGILPPNSGAFVGLRVRISHEKLKPRNH